MRRVFWGCVGALAGTIALSAAGYLRPSQPGHRARDKSPACRFGLRHARQRLLRHLPQRPPSPREDWYSTSLSIEQVGEHPETWEKVVSKAEGRPDATGGDAAT